VVIAQAKPTTLEKRTNKKSEWKTGKKRRAKKSVESKKRKIAY
jgi:hypothetical protein